MLLWQASVWCYVLWSAEPGYRPVLSQFELEQVPQTAWRTELCYAPMPSPCMVLWLTFHNELRYAAILS
eukprot:250243-Rhodomonas_salina.1